MSPEVTKCPRSKSPHTYHSRATSARTTIPGWLPIAWAGFVLVALLLLAVLPLVVWGVVVPVAACVLLAVTAPAARGMAWVRRRADVADLAAVAALYVGVVGLFRVAFAVFTPDRVVGLFLCFSGGLVLGVAGPVA